MWIKCECCAKLLEEWKRLQERLQEQLREQLQQRLKNIEVQTAGLGGDLNGLSPIEKIKKLKEANCYVEVGVKRGGRVIYRRLCPWCRSSLLPTKQSQVSWTDAPDDTFRYGIFQYLGAEHASTFRRVSKHYKTLLDEKNVSKNIRFCNPGHKVEVLTSKNVYNLNIEEWPNNRLALQTSEEIEVWNWKTRQQALKYKCCKGRRIFSSVALPNNHVAIAIGPDGYQADSVDIHDLNGNSCNLKQKLSFSSRSGSHPKLVFSRPRDLLYSLSGPHRAFVWGNIISQPIAFKKVIFGHYVRRSCRVETIGLADNGCPISLDFGGCLNVWDTELPGDKSRLARFVKAGKTAFRERHSILLLKDNYLITWKRGYKRYPELWQIEVEHYRCTFECELPYNDIYCAATLLGHEVALRDIHGCIYVLSIEQGKCELVEQVQVELAYSVYKIMGLSDGTLCIVNRSQKKPWHAEIQLLQKKRTLGDAPHLCRVPVHEVRRRTNGPIIASLDDDMTFYDACSTGDYEQVHAFIVRLNDYQLTRSYGRNGETPLYIACQNGHVDVVDVLCNELKDRNLLNDINTIRATTGFAPIAVAAFRGHHSVVELLCKYGAKPNIKAKTGFYKEKTPLEIALIRNQIKVVKILSGKKLQ